MSLLRLRFAVAVTVPCALALTTLAGPPATERKVVTDTFHDFRFDDPYRWLEGSAGFPDLSPAEAESLDNAVSDWTDAQNEYTRSILDELPGRARLEARIAELMSVDWIGTPSTSGSRFFNMERYGDQNQSVLYVRDSLDAQPRTLIDPNTLDEGGLTSLDWYTPTPDGSLVAFGLSRAGDEISTLYVMDVDTGRWLADEIGNDAGGVSWLPDRSGFLYRVRREKDDPYSAQIKFHRLGTHHRQDPVLFEQHDQTWGPYAYLSRDARWLIYGYWTGTDSNDLWVVDFDRWQRTGEIEKVTIIEGQKATFGGPVYGDTLFMTTTLDAPNGCVFAVDLNNPDREQWKLLIPEKEDAVLEELSTARGMLVAKYASRAYTRIDRFDLQGNHLGELTLPGVGSASVGTDDDRTTAFVNYSSFDTPPSIYHADLEQNTLTLWASPEVPVDPSIMQVSQVTYSSKDGTPVTMFLVHRKDLELNGDNPTLLYGYGGFNISMSPYFSRTLFPWLEEGGVYAVPNLRGGGEYGESWHRAGMLENKQNVFDDYIAAAEWLIDNRYTNPERLAIHGGSNGGLLVGAVAMQRPDLFKAVVCAVPLLDMLRYQYFLMARYWVPEYGSSEDAEQLSFLVKYSPYHNIKEGVEYPAMLIKAGENDARVHPFHARKMAAYLQHATTSDPQEEPILLWVDRDAGHGSGKPLKNVIRDLADDRIFLMWQLGMLD